MDESVQKRADELTIKWQERIRARQAEAIAKMKPVEVPLPKGDPVLAVKIPVITLLEAGRIPDGLTPFAIELMRLGNTQGNDNARAQVQEQIEKRWAEFTQLLEVVWTQAVVAPKATLLAYEEGFVSVSNIEIEDKLALFNWCQGVTDHLADFREKPRVSARVVAAQSSLSKVHPGRASGPGPLRPGDAAAELADQPVDDALGPVRGRSPKREGRKAGPAT